MKPIDDFRQKIGATLRKFRKEAKLSQEEIGEAMELHQAAVSRVEAGTQGILLEQLLMFCHRTGYSIEEILEEAADPELDEDNQDESYECKHSRIMGLPPADAKPMDPSLYRHYGIKE